MLSSLAQERDQLPRGGSVQRNTFIQLLLIFLLIALASVFFWNVPAVMLIACGGGFLLSLTIPYNLHQLESALTRLAYGLPNQPIFLWHASSHDPCSARPCASMRIDPLGLVEACTLQGGTLSRVPKGNYKRNVLMSMVAIPTGR